MSGKVMKKNAYAMYCEHMKRSENLRISLKEATNRYRDRYQNLEEGEREYWKRKAKAWNEKHTGRHVLTGKVDLTGQLVTERGDPLDNEDARRVREREERIWMKGSDKSIQKRKFIFISILDTFKDDNDQYYPVEVALSSYSIEKGFIDNRHFFVKPELPRGCASFAREQAEKTHRITLLHGNDDIEFLTVSYAWRKLLGFINPEGSRTVEFPVIYARDGELSGKEILIVESCIQFLARQSNEVSPLEGKVHIVDYMIKDVVDMCQAPNLLEMASVNEALYSKHYDHEPNLKCEFHDNEENPHCALRITHMIGLTMTKMLLSTRLLQDVTPAHQPHKKSGDQVAFVDVSHHFQLAQPITHNVKRPSKPPREQNFGTMEFGKSDGLALFNDVEGKENDYEPSVSATSALNDYDFELERDAPDYNRGVVPVPERSKKKVKDGFGQKVAYDDDDVPDFTSSDTFPSLGGVAQALPTRNTKPNKPQPKKEPTPLSRMAQARPHVTANMFAALGDDDDDDDDERLVDDDDDDDDDDDYDDATEEAELQRLRAAGKGRGRGITIQK